ncbi:cobalt ABC transporter ATP-binding protein [Corynebacterium yudongzhengii]|uniref:ABC transporter ATP-binding protein n=1 Tax=Corynebacterium yudongzhengii TaxID=2080740 RepID=A0A2U1T592_9CORY|nr:ABC transporter ATP-binding protein [Corynebacterium yudongzhengii]AWB81741.1 cobalt ABC transporter ATP-binding protein [Corynebacterium yudongzhengii]PWC01174.1 ABC transporter ATP-binding protein [Corynebacterium yudongzhengii]
MAVVEFRDVEVTVDAGTDADPHATRRILGPLNLTLSEHRIGIIGANGSGKSTLARLINGLNSPTTGEVLYDGLNLASEAKAVRRQVGFVFSDAENQIVMPQVRDDVLFSLRRSGLPKAARRERADAVLEYFGLAAHAEDSPHTLSGGQKQLLALAAVIVVDPQLIIADEPTTLLDLRNRLSIARRFRELSQQLIVVTHDLDLLRDFDRVICIDDGQVVGDGAPGPVIDHYIHAMENNA